MNVTWVKIESWHALDEMTNKTVCGRDVEKAEVEELRDTLPAEKSCESCLRILARRADVAET